MLEQCVFVLSFGGPKAIERAKSKVHEQQLIAKLICSVTVL